MSRERVGSKKPRGSAFTIRISEIRKVFESIPSASTIPTAAAEQQDYNNNDDDRFGTHIGSFFKSEK
jgi:hypothetical protein